MTEIHTGTAADQLPVPGRYRIDRQASTVRFRTRHLFGLARVQGTFAVLSGLVDVEEPLADSIVQVEIDAASFATGNRQRDTTVTGPRYLDGARYPAMTFGAGRLERTNEGWALNGTLTVRDVACPVRLQLADVSIGPASFTVDATVRVDRVEFGVSAARGLAGRYLDVAVHVEASLV